MWKYDVEKEFVILMSLLGGIMVVLVSIAVLISCVI